MAQTAEHSTPKVHSAPCTDAEDLTDCGLRADVHKDYDIAISAWSRGAEQGDSTSAFWLAELYEDGHGGVEQILVHAYKWYDIAAALKAIEIDKLPAGSDSSNKAEINYRNAIPKHMPPSQIGDAQMMAREWLSRTANARAHRERLKSWRERWLGPMC
jgi:TPR repeat protein